MQPESEYNFTMHSIFLVFTPVRRLRKGKYLKVLIKNGESCMLENLCQQLNPWSVINPLGCAESDLWNDANQIGQTEKISLTLRLCCSYRENVVIFPFSYFWPVNGMWVGRCSGSLGWSPRRLCKVYVWVALVVRAFWTVNWRPLFEGFNYANCTESRSSGEDYFCDDTCSYSNLNYSRSGRARRLYQVIRQHNWKSEYVTDFNQKFQKQSLGI